MSRERMRKALREREARLDLIFCAPICTNSPDSTKQCSIFYVFSIRNSPLSTVKPLLHVETFGSNVRATALQKKFQQAQHCVT